MSQCNVKLPPSISKKSVEAESETVVSTQQAGNRKGDENREYGAGKKRTGSWVQGHGR
jgi:hypothetical protein